MKKIRLRCAVLVMSCFFVSAASADLNKGLVAHWNFDDCSAVNAAGKDLKGKVYGNPECTDGVVGKAFRLNGKDDFIEVAHHPSLQLEQFSLCAWVSPVEFKGDTVLMERGDQKSYYLMLEDSKPVMGLYGSNASHIRLKAGTDIPESEWTFICGTYDGNQMKMYINDQLDGTEGVKVKKRSKKAALSLSIGSRAQDAQRGAFSGLLDEVRIYGRALTESEVRELYAAGNSTEGEDQWLKGSTKSMSEVRECQPATFSSETDILYIPDMEMNGKHYKVFMLKGENESTFTIIKKTLLE